MTDQSKRVTNPSLNNVQKSQWRRRTGFLRIRFRDRVTLCFDSRLATCLELIISASKPARNFNHYKVYTVNLIP